MKKPHFILTAVPKHWMGWVVVTFYILANIAFFLRIDQYSHSVSDTLIGWSGFFLVTTVAHSLFQKLLTRNGPWKKVD